MGAILDIARAMSGSSKEGHEVLRSLRDKLVKLGYILPVGEGEPSTVEEFVRENPLDAHAFAINRAMQDCELENGDRIAFYERIIIDLLNSRKSLIAELERKVGDTLLIPPLHSHKRPKPNTVRDIPRTIGY